MFGTEYRVEWLKPPYMTQERPVILGVNGGEKRFRFGQETVMKVQYASGLSLRGRNVQGTLLGIVDPSSNLLTNPTSFPDGPRLCHSRCSRQLSPRVPRQFGRL